MNIDLAPIVLFTYNRPWHTEQTIEFLSQNKLADESVLYIYCDGPKENTTSEQLDKIKHVREVIRKKKWCKEINIIESEINKGLADSIIDGVTEIVNQYGKIIVLEDDLDTSPGFLQYMNDALNIYEDEKKVYHISTYMFPVKAKLPVTSFYRLASCWGWGTWSDRWRNLDCDAKSLYRQLFKIHEGRRLDIDGTDQFWNQLVSNVEQRKKTWAVLWHFSIFLNDGFCLHPGRSLVKNIGTDGTGVNSNNTDIFEVEPINEIKVEKIKVKDYKKVYPYLKNFYRSNFQIGLMSSIKDNLKPVIPLMLRNPLRMLIDKEFRSNELEKKEFESFPAMWILKQISLTRKSASSTVPPTYS